VARRSSGSRKSDAPSRSRSIQGAPLKPIRVVQRELTRPDGTRVTVDVPVYPPFQLEKRPEPRPPAKTRSEGKDEERKTG
jgi:hypothetical protein